MRLLLAAVPLLALAAACAPAPATAPSTGPPSTTIRVSSPDFTAGGVLPARFTCTGAGDTPAPAVVGSAVRHPGDRGHPHRPGRAARHVHPLGRVRPATHRHRADHRAAWRSPGHHQRRRPRLLAALPAQRHPSLPLHRDRAAGPLAAPDGAGYAEVAREVAAQRLADGQVTATVTH